MSETSIIRKKSITPGQRGAVTIKSKLTSKRLPKSLLKSKKRCSGRNSYGRITVRHRGGGHKRKLRIIDFYRNKVDVPAVVEEIQYDPNRTANIALLCYADGSRTYIIAPEKLSVGDQVMSGKNAPITPGCSLELNDIPVGTEIHCIESKPNRGSVYERSAGASARLLGKENKYALVKLSSSTVIKLPLACRATIGSVGNSKHNLRKYGKAGKIRHLGIRPTVRGVAMNPVDHPLGGGEGRTSGGRPPCSPWGTPEGKKTRKKKKYSKVNIVSGRNKKERK